MANMKQIQWSFTGDKETGESAKERVAYNPLIQIMLSREYKPANIDKTVFAFAAVNLEEFETFYDKSIKLSQWNKYMADAKEGIPRTALHWNEYMPECGRPFIADIDFEKGKRQYNVIAKQFGIDEDFESRKFTKMLGKMCIESFEADYPQLSEILKKRKIRWYNNNLFDHGAEVAPFCLRSTCRENKISYHLTLPFVLVREVVNNSLGYTSNSTFDQEVKMQPVMKWWYKKMDELAKKYIPDLILESGDHLFDFNLCKDGGASLRLPGHTKHKNMGKEECKSRFLIPDQTIMHAISHCNHEGIPEELFFVYNPKLHVDIQAYKIHLALDEESALESEDIQFMIKCFQNYDEEHGSKSGLEPDFSDINVNVVRLNRKRTGICPISGTEHGGDNAFLVNHKGQIRFYCHRKCSIKRVCLKEGKRHVYDCHFKDITGYGDD